MAVMTSAGTTLATAVGSPATYDAAGFAALTWILVGEITDLGSFGKNYTEVKHTALGQRQTKKFRGSYDNGELPLKLGRDTSDVGQAALIVALESDLSQSFKVVLQDGTIEYFTGKVMSYVTNVGSVDQITGAEAKIGIDNEIIEV